MTLGEDLLLLAVHPRSGRVRNVERMAPALRALEVVELSLAERIGLERGRIQVNDSSPVGHRLLDRALSALSGQAKPTTLKEWLGRSAAESGVLGQYWALLGRQQVVRIGHRGQGLARATVVTVRDHERYTQARARIDRVAHREASATAGDQALAGIVHACGLSRQLCPGPHRLVARRRLARFADHLEAAESIRSAANAADAEMAQAVAEALSRGIATMAKELTTVLRQEYRLETYSSHSYGEGHHHHHTSTDTFTSGHHPGSGGGHHHG
jgi:hypothetical protein